MENNQKKRYTVEIAGNSLTIVSDENESFVRSVAAKLDTRIGDLLKASFRISLMDAITLCALDYLAEGMKAEKKLRGLEAQLELYEVNMQNMREELEKYRNAELAGTQVDSVNRVEEIGDALRHDEGGSSEDKIRTLEKYLEGRRTAARNVSSDSKTREEKIKYIESLLRGAPKSDK